MYVGVIFSMQQKKKNSSVTTILLVFCILEHQKNVYMLHKYIENYAVDIKF